MMENYNLMWGDFTSNLSMTVKDLRNDADFLDVSIACEDETIEAHKVILSAASPFFRSILKKNKHPHPYIYLNGVKFKDMKNLIDFMYNGEATVSHEDLDKFMSVANDLKVKGLTRSDFSESSTKYLGNIVAAEPEPEPASVPLALDTSRKPVASKSKAPTVAASPHRFVSQTPKIIKANASYITRPRRPGWLCHGANTPGSVPNPNLPTLGFARHPGSLYQARGGCRRGEQQARLPRPQVRDSRPGKPHHSARRIRGQLRATCDSGDHGQDRPRLGRTE